MAKQSDSVWSFNIWIKCNAAFSSSQNLRSITHPVLANKHCSLILNIRAICIQIPLFIQIFVFMILFSENFTKTLFLYKTYIISRGSGSIFTKTQIIYMIHLQSTTHWKTIIGSIRGVCLLFFFITSLR